MKKTKEQQIAFWKSHYHYIQSLLCKLDAGLRVQVETIAELQFGQREAFYMEINKSVEKLAALGNFDFQKIEDSTPTKNAQIREHLAETSKERRSKNRFRFGLVEIYISEERPIKWVEAPEYIRVSIYNPTGAMAE